MNPALQLFALRPLQFATGVYSRKLLPKNPSASLVAFCFAYWAVLFWMHYGEAIQEQPLKLAEPLLAFLLLPPRWRLAVFLGWGALDIIWMLTEWQNDFWNWVVYALAALRSLSKE